MSGKFNGSIWRKIKEGGRICIAFTPFVLQVVGLAIIMVLISAIITGIIVAACWNIAMPKMFGVNNITWFQAFMLMYAINGLRTNYAVKAETQYAKLKEKIFNKSKKEKMSKVVSLILTVVFELILICINVWVVMYTWNSILPQLLKIELFQINFVHAIGFSGVCYWLFPSKNSDNNEHQEDEESKNTEKVEETEKEENETENLSKDDEAVK